jgi:hypothetical protein
MAVAGDQAYVLAPLAENVTGEPKQVVKLGVAVTVGFATKVTVFVSATEHVPTDTVAV